MWNSDEPIDDYALVHLASASGDTLVALALADSIFFSLPVDQASVRVALYLALTMAPLAVAGPVLVPLLDRGRYRRTISFAASAGRSVAALLAAPRVSSLLLFPLTFLILVLSKVHSISKTALAAAYASPDEGLVSINARLGRVAGAGVGIAVGPGLLVLALGGSTAVLYLASAVFAVAALLNLQLERRDVDVLASSTPGERPPVLRGRIPDLGAAAAGNAALRAAQGFLVFLVAFGLRRAGLPTYWLGVAVGAGVVGGVLGDVLAPRVSEQIREEVAVLGSLLAAGVVAFAAFEVFSLPVLAVFSLLSGMSTEIGRLAFQSLMQRRAPAGAHGRVFVRYEVAFQLAWVAGALIPALIPISLRTGLLALAAFDVAIGAVYFLRRRRREDR
jgi:hypothetical protein